MTISEWKKIARVLKQVYAELEAEAIAKGINVLSPEYEELRDRARLAVLEKAGFTLEEYRSVKEQVEGVSKDGMLAVMQDTQKKLEELKEVHIPDQAEIKSIAHEVAKEYIKPPQITNQIIKEVTIKEPQIIKETTIEKVVEEKNYNEKPLMAEIAHLHERVDAIKVPSPYDDSGLKQFFKDYFSDNFQKNINTLGMPDFRKLAMGLREDIDTKIQGVGTLKLTLSSTAPVNPKYGDLWFDVS